MSYRCAETELEELEGDEYDQGSTPTPTGLTPRPQMVGKPAEHMQRDVRESEASVYKLALKHLHPLIQPFSSTSSNDRAALTVYGVEKISTLAPLSLL